MFEMREIFDVAIVGAGLSGLQAATDIQESGRSFVVLEARDRVGGKTFSVPRADGRGCQELGAAWINDTNQALVWSYCKKFGLTPVMQNIKGNVAVEDENGKCHFIPYGSLPKFSESEQADIASLRDKIEKMSLDETTFTQPLRAELDSLTLEAWCRREGAGKRAFQTVRSWCRGSLGQEPHDVSALGFLEVARGGLGIINLRHDGKHGAQYLRLREGTQTISQKMAGMLLPGSVRLNSPVSAVTSVSSKLHFVTLLNGEIIKAQKVILTLPSPAYKTITFDPPLPRARQLYQSSVRYGVFIKYVCLFRSPWWRSLGACGLVQSFKGPMNHCRDVSVDEDENFALSTFICGQPGRAWMVLDEDARREAIVHQLSSVFQVAYQTVQSELLDTITSEWGTDRWTGWGCPFAMPPPGTLGLTNDGDLSTSEVLGKYFVGTELTNEWRGYMEGALRSGKAGAGQALADISRSDTHL